jgi:hypothetical protein
LSITRRFSDLHLIHCSLPATGMSLQPLFGPPFKPLQDIQTVDPTQLLSVNCLSYKDEPTKAFTVKISKTDNVSILKELIKEKNAPHLDHLAAKDLILYKVSLPTVDIDSNTDSKATPAVMRIHLQPLEEIQDVFPETLQKSHVHIIFEHGPSMCFRLR